MDHALKCAMQEQAKTAVLEGKWEQLRFLGNRFERAGCYAEAWNALADRVEKTSTQTLPIWPGPKAISNGVLVLPRSRDLGDELRILRYLGNLQAHTQRVTALVDPRLAPLLERNIPGLVCTDPAHLHHFMESRIWRHRNALPCGLVPTQSKSNLIFVP